MGREKDVDAVQAAVCQHIFYHFYGIVAHHADVGDALLGNQFAEIAYAWPVHINGEEIGVGQPLGDLGGGDAHAKADF